MRHIDKKQLEKELNKPDTFESILLVFIIIYNIPIIIIMLLYYLLRGIK